MKYQLATWSILKPNFMNIHEESNNSKFYVQDFS